jgi:hypothetical protein
VYSFSEGLSVTKSGTEEILRWMRKRRETLKIQNFENDRAYQRHDVDYIWVTKNNIHLVEIKVDRYGYTGNFFLETQSCKEKNTPGCFIYTKSTLFFYYFQQIKKLYVLPMPLTRQWFLEREESFPQRETTTLLPDGDVYTTVGRLVPIIRVVQEIPEVREIVLT